MSKALGEILAEASEDMAALGRSFMKPAPKLPPPLATVPITLDGQPRQLGVAFAAVVYFEQVTRSTLHAFARSIVARRQTMTDVAAAVAAGLQATGSKITALEAGDLVMRTGVDAVLPAVVEWLERSLNKGERMPEPEKPAEAPAPAGGDQAAAPAG